MAEHDKIVTEFVIDQVHPRVLNAYDLLAALEYPIADQQELNRKLEKQGSPEELAAVELIRSVIDPLHLPFLSPRGALEKLCALFKQKEIQAVLGGETRVIGKEIERTCLQHFLECAVTSREGELVRVIITGPVTPV